jgi:PKD repeat protein
MRISLLIFLVCLAATSFGQTIEAMQKNLNQFKADQQIIDSEQAKKAKEFATKNNIPITYTDDFRTTLLVGVDDYGIPIFLSTDNEKAAITTGVVKLRSEGPLGLNLEGSGVKLGVWDGGKVAHVEYNSRILSTEGANNDSHATHVTGTILASGINPSAKGMAPKATIVSFDFNNALSEMGSLAKPDQSSIILSNHSYGFVTGWDCTVNPCQWRGNPAISSQEDYRFGFYSSSTRSWDLIANYAPYYLMIKSAGNDRSAGSGSVYPADCNGGTGYDCIEEQAAAKNIFTIGAVNAVLNYTDANSVVMSSFSGWGPTDDGRIKPDIVADGVSVFSTLPNDSYGNLSGTSMSSPNVTGSLTLIQELYKKLNGGNYMLSSTLKALSIHTAKEAGAFPGPDYNFGWGLLDVESAANLLLKRDDQNILIKELILKDGEEFKVTLLPKANQRITATLVWNDPAGTPAPISLDPTTSMLVNDLDMRLIDNNGVQQFPWSLNPETSALGQAATRVDNFRDNVEKIEFESPEERSYTLRVNSKRLLVGGSQQFSLIVSYVSVNSPPTTLYWVGGNGDWNDTAHWSLTSGGSSSGVIPSLQSNVVFDQKSFDLPGSVNFASDGFCRSLLLLSSASKVGIALNSKTLNIGGDFIAADSAFALTNEGTFVFSNGSGAASSINLNNSNFNAANFLFDGASFAMNGSARVGTVKLIRGTLDMSNSVFTIQNLLADGSLQKTLNFKNSKISGLSKFAFNTLNNSILVSDSVSLSPQSPSAQWLLQGVYLKGIVSIKGALDIVGENRFFKVEVDGTLNINGNNSFDNVLCKPGVSINLSDKTTLTFTRNTVMTGTPSSRINLGSLGLARLNFEGSYKLCFDYLTISNVALSGSASVNAGINSQVTNSSNWQQDECQNILFPDFDWNYPCVGSLTGFNDKSQGLVTNYSWDFGNPGVVTTGNTLKNTFATFKTTGIFTVQLTISNSKFSKSIQKLVSIKENDLTENEIVINNLNLFSREFAPAYQWLKDGTAIFGATLRTYPYNGNPGIYSIITSNETCNRQSPSLLITSANEGSWMRDSPILLYPNPAQNHVMIENSVSADLTKVVIYNLEGQVLFQTDLSSGYNSLDISNLANGVYVVAINGKGNFVHKQKLIILK